MEAGKEHPLQRPVYYVSEVLTSSKQPYPHWQKLVLGVFMASRKLKHYFQEHPITVVSSAPLADIIQYREATGRIAKWAIELGAYHIQYAPRTAIRSQALVDFINDWTEIQAPPEKHVTKYWTMHFDGSQQLQGSGAGVVLTSPTGEKFCYVLQLQFICTNNAAAYEVLLHGIQCYDDFDLVSQQVLGTWDSKDPMMVAYR